MTARAYVAQACPDKGPTDDPWNGPQTFSDTDSVLPKWSEGVDIPEHAFEVEGEATTAEVLSRVAQEHALVGDQVVYVARGNVTRLAWVLRDGVPQRLRIRNSGWPSKEPVYWSETNNTFHPWFSHGEWAFDLLRELQGEIHRDYVLRVAMRFAQMPREAIWHKEEWIKDRLMLANTTMERNVLRCGIDYDGPNRPEIALKYHMQALYQLWTNFRWQVFEALGEEMPLQVVAGAIFRTKGLVLP